MKKTLFIGVLLLWKLSFSQDTCRPRYDLPVRTHQVAGINMAYVEEGKGQPILFIHGLGGNLSHWLKAMHELSKHCLCIAVDLPGYGHSDKTFSTGDKDQLQFYSDVLAEFISQKKLKKLVLAGHSMGGQIAVILAIQHPELISKLVLVAPAGLETFTGNEAKMMMGATPAAFFEKQDERTIRYSFKQNFYELTPDVENLVQDRLRLKSCSDFRQYTEAVSNGIKGMLQHPVKNDLAKVKQPVLILYGDNDALIPNKVLHPALTRESLIKDALSLMPKARSAYIPNAGHMVQFERPKETSEQIKKYLQ